MSEVHAERRHPVTPLELFLDPVFVFGLTEVTTFLSDDPTWHGLSRGVFSARRAVVDLGRLRLWPTNTVDPDEDEVLAAMLVASRQLCCASPARALPPPS